MALDATAVAETFARALTARGVGPVSLLELVGRLDGVRYTPAQPKVLFRAGTPAVLEVGDWHFRPPTSGDGLITSHVVHGIALQTTDVAPLEAAQRLAAALVEQAERRGPDAEQALESMVYGLDQMLNA